MSDVMYLVVAACDWCEEVTRHVEVFDEPIPVDQDVPISPKSCPKCTRSVPVWDVHEEAEIERVDPRSGDDDE